MRSFKPLMIVVVIALSKNAWGDVIQEINLSTNGLVYDMVSGYVYASVPSSAGAGLGNTITRISPYSGALSGSTFVGSEPGAMAVSDNGQYIYAALNGAAAVRRYDIATQTAGLQFSLGNNSFGPNLAEDIAVAPGNANLIAVSRRNTCCSPRHEGVAIFDNGVQRPTTTPGHTGSNRIAFSSTASRLYGYNNETTEYGFRRMDVTASGVTTVNTTNGIISGFGTDIEYAGGRIYATSGAVINPETSSLLGTFAASGILEADTVNQRIFFLTGSGSTRTLTAFDMNFFVPLASISIPNVAGTPTDLIRWGSNGLAFRTTSSEVFLISSNIVPEPGSLGILILIGAIVRRRRRP